MKNRTNLKDLLLVLTQKEIKVRYKSTVLGYLWSIGNPLVNAVVFYIAFKVVMRIQMEAYPLFLIAGLFPWQWFSNSVNMSPMIFLANAGIIKKVNFPKNVLPLANVLQDMVHFVLSIPVIIIFLLLYDRTPSFIWLAGIPVMLTIQLAMIYGVSLLVSSVNLFFRDMERLTVIFMTFVFYFTPVIYPESMVPEKYRWALMLNPVATIMINWRKLFLQGTLDGVYLILGMAYATAALIIGYRTYRTLHWRFAEVL